MIIRNALIGLVALTASAVAVAGKKEPVLNPRHPDRYVVAPGDTLWDVAGKFLKDPWQWPDLWESQNRADRPLRPGDVLTLTQVNGKPRLILNSDGPQRAGGLPVVKLSPKIRAGALLEEIPTIPLSAIRAFLASPRVASEEELDDAPYLLDFADDRLIVGAGDKVYVRGLDDMPATNYGLFRKGAAYRDGETGEALGYEAVLVGGLRLLQEGDPATFVLTQVLREAKAGDRLLPLEEERIPTRYEPHAPDFEVKGHIIGVMDGVSRIGQYSVVAVDRGRNDGLEAGHTLAVYQSGRLVRDRVSGKYMDQAKLPDEPAASLLIFRPFERVSYGLVMKATRDLRVGDAVQTP